MENIILSTIIPDTVEYVMFVQTPFTSVEHFMSWAERAFTRGNAIVWVDATTKLIAIQCLVVEILKPPRELVYERNLFEARGFWDGKDGIGNFSVMERESTSAYWAEFDVELFDHKEKRIPNQFLMPLIRSR